MSEMKALNRKEAIMMGEEITPMTREEAILQNKEGLKIFTKDEYLRLNNYKLSLTSSTSLEEMTAEDDKKE